MTLTYYPVLLGIWLLRLLYRRDASFYWRGCSGLYVIRVFLVVSIREKVATNKGGYP